MILNTAGFMLFFWAIYDGIISYLTPIIMENRGLSNSAIGMLISLSAISGAIFDVLISKYFRFSHYLRFFIFIYIICLTYPLLLWSASNIALYAFLMAAWGLTYDFINFGIYDLAARISKKNEHTKNITLINSFKSIGYLIGPLVITYLISSWSLNSSSFFLVYLFLAISLSFYVILFSFSSLKEFLNPPVHTPTILHWGSEIHLWKKFGKILFPVLVFNVMMFIFEATFWTIGPIFSQQFPEYKYFSIIFMSVYILPTILVIKFAEPITRRFGKKHTAYISFIISSLLLIPFAFITSPFYLLILVFFSTTTGSLAWSAIAGAFVDYISESELYNSEIIGLKDFSSNIGYIIGPTLAGIVSDQIGIRPTFACLGILCALVVSTLFLITPRHINVT
jgi:MFS family permease